MLPSYSISVLICTRNRSALLRTCLLSLIKQSSKPREVIVVDNGSTDDTKAMCRSFSQLLPIRYYHEKKIGIPYGRNTGIQHVRGDICAFIDDDCKASTQWIRSIENHFEIYQQSVGVIGKTNPTSINNVYSAVEYVYYCRWMLKNIENPNRMQKLLSGTFIDFKNAAFKRSFIAKELFSTTAPFGDVGDEDIELGSRLYKRNNNIYYDPTVRVSHQYTTTLQRLFARNFWNGYSNQMLYLQFGINPSKTIIKTQTNAWRWTFLTRPYFVLLILCYPLASKTGKLYAFLINIFRKNVTIPIR